MKPKTFFFFSDSDETKVTCGENLPLSAIDEKSHDTKTIDFPSLIDKQILIEERLVNYEIIEIILVDVVKLYDPRYHGS